MPIPLPLASPKIDAFKDLPVPNLDPPTAKE
jgi:hypothetical protein